MEKPRTRLTHHEREQVLQAATYAAAHLQEALTVGNVATAFGLSIQKLNTGLLALYGQNFTPYLRELRMGKAKRLLLETNAIIWQVARECGYQSEAGFYRLFKKRFGQTPDDFRKV